MIHPTVLFKSGYVSMRDATFVQDLSGKVVAFWLFEQKNRMGSSSCVAQEFEDSSLRDTKGTWPLIGTMS